MIKRFSFTVSFTLIFYCSPAQFDTAFAKKNIHQCADSLTYAFKIKDWELFARYSYPALIGSMGGKDEFKKFMSLMFSEIPDSAWKQYEPGNILQVIQTGGDLQTVIELRSMIEWEGKRITSVTHLVGESWDGGLFWTFFSNEGERNAALAIKPDLSDKLIIPKIIEKSELISPRPKPNNSP